MVNARIAVPLARTGYQGKAVMRSTEIILAAELAARIIDERCTYMASWSGYGRWTHSASPCSATAERRAAWEIASFGAPLPWRLRCAEDESC